MALGIWVIRIDEMNGKFEMYTDDIMNRILGLKDVVSPEECYRYWYDRIVEEDKEYINLTVENIIQSGKIYQVEYMWVHPERGTVPVRCVGIRRKTGKEPYVFRDITELSATWNVWKIRGGLEEKQENKTE